MDTIDENIVYNNGIDFPKWDLWKNLTLFLYPNDSNKEGQLIRVAQQYFMVSSTAQLIIDEMKEKNYNLHELDRHTAVQINDTHPSMIIPELIRLLTEKEGFSSDEAVDVVTKTCAYTNHTILAEALEKWPVDYIQTICPQLIPIIEKLNQKAIEKCENNPKTNIIVNGYIHMANMDIHYSHSINDVAALHTEILKNSELDELYKLYSEKFNNKTNGITFRRWLTSCNKELTNLISDSIGNEFKKNAMELEKLEQFKNDNQFLNELEKVKQTKKQQLAKYLKEYRNIEMDPNSIFDCQTKRLHEYKRQQMNLLYIIDKYHEIKDGIYSERPITFIFGAKAAPSYTIAKDIIHSILVMRNVINDDHVAKKYINIVMPENYNVTLAEKIIPAANLSEQISVASKEASGTGNMKYMLRAPTIGTDDGANVEIHNLVGDDNIYIFGMKANEIIDLYANGNYHAIL